MWYRCGSQTPLPVTGAPTPGYLGQVSRGGGGEAASKGLGSVLCDSQEQSGRLTSVEFSGINRNGMKTIDFGQIVSVFSLFLKRTLNVKLMRR